MNSINQPRRHYKPSFQQFSESSEFNEFEEMQLLSLRFEINRCGSLKLDDDKFKELERQGFSRNDVKRYVSYLLRFDYLLTRHDGLQCVFEPTGDILDDVCIINEKREVGLS